MDQSFDLGNTGIGYIEDRRRDLRAYRAYNMNKDCLPARQKLLPELNAHWLNALGVLNAFIFSVCFTEEGLRLWKEKDARLANIPRNILAAAEFVGHFVNKMIRHAKNPEDSENSERVKQNLCN